MSAGTAHRRYIRGLGTAAVTALTQELLRFCLQPRLEPIWSPYKRHPTVRPSAQNRSLRGRSEAEAHKAGQHIPNGDIWHAVGSLPWMGGFRTGYRAAKEDPKSAAGRREGLEKAPTFVTEVASGKTLIERLVNTIAQPKYEKLTDDDISKAIGMAMWESGYVAGVKEEQQPAHARKPGNELVN